VKSGFEVIKARVLQRPPAPKSTHILAETIILEKQVKPLGQLRVLSMSYENGFNTLFDNIGSFVMILPDDEEGLKNFAASQHTSNFEATWLNTDLLSKPLVSPTSF
jgi:hypothetical protein